MVNLVKTQETVTATAGTKRLDLTPVKHGYTPERHPTKKQKGSTCKPVHHPPRKLKITVRDEMEDQSEEEEQSPTIKSFKEMVAALQNSSDSDDDFESDFKPLDSSGLFFQKLDEPTENEKQMMCAKFYMSDLFDQTHDYQMVKTTELWEYREFDRSLTPKLGNANDHLEQVRRFILKKGFQEPLIISCDLQNGRAYLTEGNHRLWVALREEIPFVPCRVIPHWLPPNGLCKNIDADLKALQSKKVILPEHLGLAVLYS